jgi:hypothetical protein
VEQRVKALSARVDFDYALNLDVVGEEEPGDEDGRYSP